jgi:hypothetical protein
LLLLRLLFGYLRRSVWLAGLRLIAVVILTVFRRLGFFGGH